MLKVRIASNKDYDKGLIIPLAKIAQMMIHHNKCLYNSPTANKRNDQWQMSEKLINVFTYWKSCISSIIIIPLGFVWEQLIYVSCCADSTSGLKSITVNKQKSNNKHTQRTQEFTWFGKLPTSTETTKKFHYKNREIQ